MRLALTSVLSSLSMVFLPPDIETLDEQVARAYEEYQQKDTDLERHIFLRALQESQ